MSEPFVDLTLAFRREQNRKRRQPLWEALWLGFALGVAFVALVFAVVTVCTR